MTKLYHVLFDGGARNNGSPTAESYGSFMVAAKLSDGTVKKVTETMTFDTGLTNNEAEYSALIAGVQYLHIAIKAAKRDPKEFALRIVGDSKLVINQVAGTWKCKASNLKPLLQAAHEMIDDFASATFEYTPRETSVRLLGH